MVAAGAGAGTAGVVAAGAGAGTAGVVTAGAGAGVAGATGAVAAGAGAVGAAAGVTITGAPAGAIVAPMPLFAAFNLRLGMPGTAAAGLGSTFGAGGASTSLVGKVAAIQSRRA